MAARPRRKFGASQKHRIFLACLPDKETVARIHARAEAFKRDKGFQAALILPEHLHVTLFHLGDWVALPEEVVKLARGAADQVSATPFAVSFQRAESFRNRTGIYPFVLTGDAAQWQSLHASLADALKKFSLGAATHGEFTPHVTLTYDKVRVKPAPIEPIGWTVKEFVLIHSELGKTTHHHLGRWPLGT